VAPGAVSARAGVARIATAAPALPRIHVRALRPPQIEAGAARFGQCRIERQVQRTRVSRRPAVVGQFNNAYNDGTSGSFDYGRERTADTDFGVAESNDSGVNWTISGTNHIGDSGTVEYPTVRRRYSRKLRSTFEFTREAARNYTCAKWSIRIRATSWIGGGDDNIKTRGLDRCIPGALGLGFPSGYGFLRNRNSATRYRRGVSVFGVSLTTESGYSQNVELRYRFRGRRGKRHWLCGPDGRQSPFESGAVLSGARRR
jgi:hypothetical protein